MRACPAITKRIHATGEVLLEMVSAHLRACDLLVQPFPDGISSRRTSAMAGIANGIPVVTNLGHLSESIWSKGGIALAPGPDPIAIARLATRLIADPEQRKRVGEGGLALYREAFALEKTISRLRGEAA
jgi:glycosyltransferase involved in cell wall biosynthesis